jgi:hypothetical protein
MDDLIKKTCELIRHSEISVDNLVKESDRNGFWSDLAIKLTSSTTKDFPLASKIKKRWQRNYKHYQDSVRAELNSNHTKDQSPEIFSLEDLEKNEFRITFLPGEWNEALMLTSNHSSSRKKFTKAFDIILSKKFYPIYGNEIELVIGNFFYFAILDLYFYYLL